MKRQFCPNDLAELFSLIARNGIPVIIIGGQAVNLHAQSYAQDIPNITQYGPLTSADLDLHGGMAEAKALVKLLHPHQHKINNGDGDVNQAGVLLCRMSGEELLIDVLAHLVGVSGVEIQQNAFQYDDVPLPLLHPITCLIAKTHNLVKLNQAERQDKKHLQLMIAVCQAHLGEEGQTARYILNNIETIVKFTRKLEARKVRREHGIQLLDAIPIEKLRQVSDPKIQIFLEKRWPQILEGVL
jgi:hypothetical protein